MPEALIDKVRRACDAWAAGDLSVHRELYSSGVIAAIAGRWAGDGSAVVGAKALLRELEAIAGRPDHAVVIPESYIESGEKLIVRMLLRRPHSDGAGTIAQRAVLALEFEDGHIVHQAWHCDLLEALDACGLPRAAASTLTDVPRPCSAAGGARSSAAGGAHSPAAGGAHSPAAGGVHFPAA